MNKLTKLYSIRSVLILRILTFFLLITKEKCRSRNFNLHPFNILIKKYLTAHPCAISSVQFSQFAMDIDLILTWLFELVVFLYNMHSTRMAS